MCSEPEWGLIDVTQMPLDRLLSADHSVLANSVRDLVRQVDTSQEVLSAFDNYAGDPDPPPDGTASA